jgi:CRISPR-associated exonuclease Cas4
VAIDGDQERILVPISALEHWSYCPRQCALIHLEQTFDENLYTIRGRLAHERVDSGEADVEDGVPALRALPLFSDRLGLIGKADLVELRATGPYPVEYKSGPPIGVHADIQVCAQALCLEDMTEQDVGRGAVFHVSTRRRREVVFDAALRALTIATTAAVRGMLEELTLPPPANDARCRSCSLNDSCQPAVISDGPIRMRRDAELFHPARTEDTP